MHAKILNNECLSLITSSPLVEEGVGCEFQRKIRDGIERDSLQNITPSTLYS